MSGLIKHNWPAQFSRNNNNKHPRGLDVHDYFTQAHINTHKSPKAWLLLELTESRTTMDLQPCRSWAGGNALSEWRLRRGLGCGKGFCACCSPPPRPPQKTPEQKQGSEETHSQTAIWGRSPGLSYQMSLWWMVGFKHRANDISEGFVIVGKYKNTLGSISHNSSKLVPNLMCFVLLYIFLLWCSQIHRYHWGNHWKVHFRIQYF